MSTRKLILILLKAGFRDFNRKGGVFLPKLLADFNGGIFYSLSERFCAISNRSGHLCAHYSHRERYKTTQPQRYQLSYTHTNYHRYPSISKSGTQSKKEKSLQNISSSQTPASESQDDTCSQFKHCITSRD